MGKLPYNDKLCMQTLWQVSTAGERQSQCGRLTADFLNSAQLSPFVTGSYGFCTKSLLTKRLHAQFVVVRQFSHLQSLPFAALTINLLLCYLYYR